VIPARIRLSGVTSQPRHSVVARLTAVLGDVGWILDFRQFSNSALSVQFEVPAREAPALRSALAELPVVLSRESAEELAALEEASAAELPDPVPASLHLTFVHSEPDLRIPVPAVPG
jgi:hypothetical protein